MNPINIEIVQQNGMVPIGAPVTPPAQRLVIKCPGAPQKKRMVVYHGLQNDDVIVCDLFDNRNNELIPDDISR